MSDKRSRRKYDLKNICRVCLTQSSNSYKHLALPLKDNQDSPLVFEALEDVMGDRIEKVDGYASGMCAMCIGLLNIAYDLKRQYYDNKETFSSNIASLCTTPKLTFYESTRVYSKPTKSVDSKDSRRINKASQTEKLDHEETEEKVKNESPDVELVLGAQSYDLKNVVIVEESATEKSTEQFHGFLQNLGSIVSATIAGKNIPSETVSKTRSEIEIVPLSEFVDINNLEPCLKKLNSEPRKMSYVCRHCNESFTSASYSKVHIPICEKFHKLQCYVCNQKMSKLPDLIAHVRKKHSIGKKIVDPVIEAHEDMLKCKICHKVLANLKRLKYHMKFHEERKHICEVCGQKFVAAYKLILHIQRAHKKETVEVCPVCSKTFHYRGALHSHMKKHSKEMTYQCKYCDRKFRYHFGKARHERMHTGERPYACHYCPKRFVAYGDCKRHEMSMHTGEKPHICELCNARFSVKDNLKIHMFQHNGSYECHICERGFVNLEVLNFHLRRKHKVTDENHEEDMEEETAQESEANDEQLSVVNNEYMDNEYLSNPI